MRFVSCGILRKEKFMRLMLIAITGLLLVGCSSNTLSGNYCTVAPPLTPKLVTMATIEQTDPIFSGQIYQHWALINEC